MAKSTATELFVAQPRRARVPRKVQEDHATRRDDRDGDGNEEDEPEDQGVGGAAAK